MRQVIRSSSFTALIFMLGLVSPLLAQSQAQNPALGLVTKSAGGFIGDAPAPDGSSVYSGDYLSTEENGALYVRVGALSFQLEPSSALHIYRAPYGAVVELDRGSVIYTTPGTKENLVIVASDVRVTPELSLSDLGRVTIDNPCEITVYSQRGQADVLAGKESRNVEEGKAYRVRALNQVTYRRYLSPDDTDYHRYHDHEPCALQDMASGHAPIAAAHSRFLLVTAALVGGATGVAIWKVYESPDKP
ncbi:MAG TPA: hypothetical protein VED66_03635 [Candidatus Sulfotelmatobacter sp.]|nr:hypothetical protein [Candidatus Sulfotelmatobacter sp.]